MQNDEIECTKYTQVNKGCVMGSLNIFVPKWGLEINDLLLFMKNGKKWITMPSRKYEKDGETKYFPFVRFRERPISEAFQQKVIKSIDSFCQETPTQDNLFETNTPF